MDRKDFFKKMGLGVGVTLAASLGSVYASLEEDKTLDSEQKAFLLEYENWLKEFQQFVHKRNDNVLDTKNNLHLMELSALAEKRRPMLEKYMKDEVFANYFNSITEEITNTIG